MALARRAHKIVQPCATPLPAAHAKPAIDFAHMKYIAFFDV
jgi:hypothetical protein